MATHNDSAPCAALPLYAHRKPTGNTTPVSSQDADLAAYRWATFRSRGGGNYVKGYIDGSPHLLHRLIMERMIGRALVSGEHVDHINRDSLDNRRENLRLANSQQNHFNMKRFSNNRSGFKGVRKDGKRWSARIKVNYQDIRLGVFDTPEQAHQAYCEAAKKYAGEFARFE